MTAAPFLSVPPGGLAPDDTFWLQAADGVRLRAALWHPERPVGHVVFLSGRTEFLEKVSITAAGFVARGLSVASLDWRGQGLSDRLVTPPAKGHVGDFAEFQRDLDALLASPQVAVLSGPRVLGAHSMGGLIGIGALGRPEIASGIHAAVFSAPLLDIHLTPVARVAASITVRIARLIGRLDRWPPFGEMATTYALSDPAENVLTSDPEVWDWMVEIARAHPEVTLAMPTLGWFDAVARETERIARLAPPGCPAICMMGSREQVVSQDAVRAWTARTGVRLVEVPGGLHELLIEAPAPRGAAWAAVDTLLSKAGIVPAPGG